MAEAISTTAAETRGNPSRRDVLKHAPAAALAATGAGLALPALAAETGDDPGLLLIESGYARWCALRARWDALGHDVDALLAQARADRPMLIPPPERAPEIVPYVNSDGTYTGKEVPPWQGRLRVKVDAHFDAMCDWRDAHPRLDGHPAYERAGALEKERDGLWDEAHELRDRILATPTRSPRGLFIKVLLAFEAEDAERLSEEAEHAGWPADDLVAAVMPDLEAMAL